MVSPPSKQYIVIIPLPIRLCSSCIILSSGAYPNWTIWGRAIPF